MSDIRCTELRFNMKIPIHKKAWDYLTGMDKGTYKSYSSVIAVAIVEYFDRQYHGTVYDEDRLIRRIAEMLQMMPKPAEEIVESTEADIDWGFLGG